MKQWKYLTIMALSAIAEDYFRSMNPIASKIHEDIVEAKNSYENIWDTLTEKEQVIITYIFNYIK